MMVANAAFACYSWFEIGCPDMRSAPTHYSDKPIWYDVVRSRAEQLLSIMPRSVCPSASVEPLGGGRLRICKMLDEACSMAYSGLPCAAAACGAEWVDLDAVEFPSVAGTVPIAENLYPSQRAQYLDVDGIALPPEEWGATVRGCHRVRPEDEPALQDSLFGSGMTGLMREDEILKDPISGKVLTGAFFAVAKPAKGDKRKRQRLIFDRRPQNRTERRLPWVHLPHACFLGRLSLNTDLSLGGRARILVISTSACSMIAPGGA